MKPKIHELIAILNEGMSKTMIIIPIVLAVFLFNCSQERLLKQTISPPISKADVPFSDFTFEASAGKTISLPNGTSIVIEPGVLEDENGRNVKGEVKLQYREIHDAVGTFLSGIPMGYDSAGVRQQLSTAGMFEMYAFAGNKPLRIKEGKSIQVNLANNEQGSEYNYYSFNKESGNWEYLSTPKAEASAVKAELIAQAAAIPPAPEQPREFRDDSPVIDINYSVAKFPELKEFSDVLWKYNGRDTDDEASEKVKTAFSKNWGKVELKQVDASNLDYSVTLSNSETDKMTLPVTPVLKGKSLDKAMAMYREKFDSYQAEVTRKEELIQAANQQGAFVRALRVNNFGIYNCDKLMNFTEMVSVKADLQIEGEEKALSTSDCYMVMKDYNTVVSFSSYGSATLRYDPRATNMVVVVLPGNATAILRPEDFKRINTSSDAVQKLVLKKEKAIGNYGDAMALLSR